MTDCHSAMSLTRESLTAFAATLVHPHHMLGLLSGRAGTDMSCWVGDPDLQGVVVLIDRKEQPGLARVSVFARKGCEMNVNALYDNVDVSKEKVKMAALPARCVDHIKVHNRLRIVSDEHATPVYARAWALSEQIPIDDTDKETVGSLTPEDAAFVNDTWTYGTPGTIAIVQDCIEQRPSACIRSPDGAILCHAVLREDSSIGMLYTAEHARGKGYATRVVRELCRRQVHSGFTPWCYIVDGNSTSERLFGRAGFTPLSKGDDAVFVWCRMDVI